MSINKAGIRCNRFSNASNIVSVRLTHQTTGLSVSYHGPRSPVAERDLEKDLAKLLAARIK